MTKAEKERKIIVGRKYYGEWYLEHSKTPAVIQRMKFHESTMAFVDFITGTFPFIKT